MTTGYMIKNAVVLKLLLIFVSFTIFSFGNTIVFVSLGILLMLLGAFASFRLGTTIGHEACAISSSLERIRRDGDKAPDPKMIRQAYSVSNGVKALLGSALIDYVINCVYIIIMLLNANETATLIARLASFLVTIPYWPVLSYWYPVYNVLTWNIVLLLMISPFLLPAVQFFGYTRGPQMWAKTEQAMADGKRRAKARSRIVKKKKQPKGQRPEI